MTASALRARRAGRGGYHPFSCCLGRTGANPGAYQRRPTGSPGSTGSGWRESPVSSANAYLNCTKKARARRRSPSSYRLGDPLSTGFCRRLATLTSRFDSMSKYCSIRRIYSKVFRPLPLCAEVSVVAAQSVYAYELNSLNAAAVRGHTQEQYELGILYARSKSMPYPSR